MGGIRKYMKITWLTSLVGSLALIGFIAVRLFIEGHHHRGRHQSTIFGHGYANFAALRGVLTALISACTSSSFTARTLRRGAAYDQFHHRRRPHGHSTTPSRMSPPWVVTLPLVLLTTVGHPWLLRHRQNCLRLTGSRRHRTDRHRPRYARSAEGRVPRRDSQRSGLTSLPFISGDGWCRWRTTCTWSTRRCQPVCASNSAAVTVLEKYRRPASRILLRQRCPQARRGLFPLR